VQNLTVKVQNLTVIDVNGDEHVYENELGDRESSIGNEYCYIYGYDINNDEKPDQLFIYILGDHPAKLVAVFYNPRYIKLFHEF